MRYYLDLTENKDGKHLLHSDQCIDNCPSYKEMSDKRTSSKFKSMDAALAWAKKEYSQWSNIEFCATEQVHKNKQNREIVQLVLVGIVFAGLVAGFIALFLWTT